MKTVRFILMIYFLGLTVLAVNTAHAQIVPHVLSYQGILKDTSGHPMPGTFDLTFKIWPDSVGGINPLWEETQTSVVVDSNGLFNVLLGSVIEVPDTVFYGNAYLGISIDGTELIPRTWIVSVAYAYNAINADKLDGYDAEDLMGGMEPSGTFIEYHYCTAACTEDLWSNIGVTREITSIKAPSNGTATDIRIDGQTIMRFRTIANFAGNDTWYKHNGAGIIVGGTSTVSIDLSNEGGVTIIGFEY